MLLFERLKVSCFMILLLSWFVLHLDLTQINITWIPRAFLRFANPCSDLLDISTYTSNLPHALIVIYPVVHNVK
jgi:uncharacterized membrane protein